MPIWYAKQVVPGSEYALWRASFDNEWRENTVLSYEFALLRRQIAAILYDGVLPDLDRFMLSSLIKEPEKPYDLMTPEEQKAAVEAAKQRADMLFGKR